jgi:hypothetical protein
MFDRINGIHLLLPPSGIEAIAAGPNRSSSPEGSESG